VSHDEDYELYQEVADTSGGGRGGGVQLEEEELYQDTASPTQPTQHCEEDLYQVCI